MATTTFMLVIAHSGSPGGNTVARALGVVLMSQIAVGALNDYHDREEDALAQPSKPIPAGLLKPWVALAMVLGAIAVEIPLALTFGPSAFLVAATGTSAGLAYDLWLKRTPFSVLGYVVGFLSLVTWVWSVAGKFDSSFLLVYPAGAVLLTAAHLANSFPDIESDRELGQRGLAALLGPAATFRAINASYAVVAVAGLALAILRHRLQAVGLLSVSGVIGVAVATWCRQAVERVEQRDRMFRLVAPGIGIMAAGCLLAVGAG
jgi:4-hydroxybenzoate polyprenyltransferase